MSFHIAVLMLSARSMFKLGIMLEKAPVLVLPANP